MRRIKIFVLLCVLLLTCANGARADDVVSADNKGFASLQDAIDAAKNSRDIVIELSADIINLTTTVVISRDTNENLTIDLKGKTISGDNVRALWIKSGDVTIKGNNGTISAKGDGGSNSSSVIRVGSDNQIAKLTIENGVTISSDNCYGITLFSKGSQDVYGQELIFNGTVAVTGTASAISGNGSSSYSATRIVISPDAIITASSDIGIYHPQSGEIIFHGGKIFGPSALEMKGGSAIIYSGDFTATSSDLRNTGNNKGPSTQGYALAAVINNAYKGSADITIFGGTFKGAVSKVSDDKSYEKYDPTVIAAGGSFDKELSGDYAAPGYVVVSADNYYTVKRNAVISSDRRPTARAKEGESLDKVVINSNDVKVYAVKPYSDGDGYTESVDVPGTWSWVSGDSQVVTFADGDNTTFEIRFTPVSLDIRTISTSIKISVDISDDAIKAVSVDNGLLSYDISSSAPLSKVLSYAKNSPDITMIPVNEKISEINSNDLDGIKSLKSLDLTGATEITTLNLEGVSVDTVVLTGNTKITSLEISGDTKISKIYASGATSLKALEISGNGAIIEIDISNTSVDCVDVTDCASLEVLSASNTGAKLVNVDGCNSLRTIDVSNNRLLFLDLSDVSDTLTTSKYSGQSNDVPFAVTSKKFDLASFILVSQDPGFDDLRSEDIIASVDLFEAISYNEILVSYDITTGIASFDKTPLGYLRYYFNVSGDSDNKVKISMDVTLTNNKYKADDPEDDNNSEEKPREPKSEDKKITVNIEGGGLTYTISYDATATLEEILKEVSNDKLGSIESLAINGQITSIDSASLGKLTSLVSLDLSGATSLEPKLELEGKSLDTLILSVDTSVTNLIISADVYNIYAEGSKLESLIISPDAVVEMIDVTNCSELETLIAKRVRARLVHVDGCDKLQKLDVSENKLLFLFLDNVSDTLVDPKYGGQTNDTPFIMASRDFSLTDFILISQDEFFDFTNWPYDNCTSKEFVAEIVASVDSFIGMSGDMVISADYSSDSGIANFEKRPPHKLIYYFNVSGDKKENIATISMDVTLLGNTSEPESADTTSEDNTGGGGNPDDDNNKDEDKVTATLSNGILSYDISGDATLDEVLAKFGGDPATIRTLRINSQITSMDLTRLTGLVRLDLTEATGLTNGVIDLEGHQGISTLTLSSGSKVSNINASGSTLQNITLAGNKNIQELNISGSDVETLDASGCSALKAIYANGTGLTRINLTGCTVLATLYVADNNLTALDLGALSSLSSGDWSGQTNDTRVRITSRDFNLAEFIAVEANLDSKDVAPKIEAVYEIDSADNTIQSARSYDTETGVVTFRKTPTEAVRYYYKVFGTTTPRAASNARLRTNMDVTLTENISVADSEDVEMEEPEVDDNGNFTYDDRESDLASVFEKFIENGGDLSDISHFELSSNLSSESITRALQMTDWPKLDLSGSDAPLLNLDGVTIGTLTLTSPDTTTSIERLTLTSGSNVSHINASGATSLTDIDLAGNGNIETLNLDGTGVSFLDASDCSNLETLSANGAKLNSINVNNCDNLKILDVANNKLLTADFSNVRDTLESSDWSGQRPDISPLLVEDNAFNLAEKIASLIQEIQSQDFAAHIASVKAYDSNSNYYEITADYNPATGIATFAVIPHYGLTYEYNVFGRVAGAETVSTAAVDPLMDVRLTLSDGENPDEEPDNPLGASGAGCNSIGRGSVLLFILMFALAFMKVKRG